MEILAIETSCDETAAAVIEKSDDDIAILSNVVASQIDIHKKFGGVFPEIASRAHVEKIIEVINQAIEQSNNQTIDVIAVTTGPGLIGSLLVGVNTAKTLAYANNKPVIGINHWLGHIYSTFSGEILNSKSKILNKSQIQNPKFPLLALIVSGGHTGLVLMKSHTDIETIGQTLDDAAGEAFDKVAKILDLGYPGGPAIALTAQRGEPLKYKFPRAMLDRDDFNFSFSGLKTAVLYESKKHKLDDKTKADFAASFQQCVIDILIGKTLQAAKKYHPKSICLCGGVSANKELRSQMSQAIEQWSNGTISLFLPPLSLTTDNAAMIGLAAAYQIANGIKPTTFENINADSNLKL